ncbi:hypothetical protein [Lactococcus formosensis]|uniref:hypothetical protein n=1 Tax=Lactococcus formosensis TaxID=1281486 RepID=UPI00254DB797|nr:hypothetical protein [Lactococcus formosensis]
MEKKKLTWPMFIYLFNVILLATILIHAVVMSLTSMFAVIPQIDGKNVIYLSNYLMLPIYLLMIYVIDRYLMEGKQNKYTLVFYLLLIFGLSRLVHKYLTPNPLAINISYYFLFIFLYIAIFIIVSLKYKLPKYIKWYLE